MSNYDYIKNKIENNVKKKVILTINENEFIVDLMDKPFSIFYGRIIKNSLLCDKIEFDSLGITKEDLNKFECYNIYYILFTFMYY